MPIALLGPLRVGEDGAEVSPRDRAVLVALALRPGTVVSADGLADALWDGKEPPKTWTKVVQGSVMRLRRVLGASVIETTSAGYRLVVRDDELDTRSFERLVERAATLADLGEPERAAITLDQALSLWRGKAFGDLNDWPPAQVEAVRLDEVRQSAEEMRLDCRLSVGAPEGLVGEARALVSVQPMREHRWALLARTLYASGRQGEALATIQQAKRVMRDELGLDVSPEVSELEAAILRHDPALVEGDQLAGAAEHPCPYRGLRPFEVADADWFFGRDPEIDACVARLVDARLVLIVGPSGSGKSSLLRAGVLSRLQSRGRRCVVVIPGSDPLASLSSGCADLEDSGVLVVDQLEEIFVAQGGAQAATFLDAFAAQVNRGTTAVAAMRGDHVIDLGCSSGFAELAERGLHIVPSLDEDGLRAAIESPARQAGLRLEPGLVDLLVRDTLGEPGGLPLLSHALVETWERREGRTMTVAGYRAAGGIRGAVAQSAERLYASLATRERDTVRAMLLRLVAPTAEGEPTSTRVAMTVMRRDAEHERLLDLLVRSRLVTTDDRTVTIAHESLGRAWPRLKGWLDQDLEGQRLLRHLASAAVEWDEVGRPDSELYRGARLQAVREWSQREQPDLTPVERDFVTASEAAAVEDEQAATARLHRERRQNRRLRWLLGATAVALAVAVVSGLLARTQQIHAAASALEADARRLGAQALTEPPLDRALLLAVHGVLLHEDADTRRNLLNTVTRTPEAVRVLHGSGPVLFDVAVSPDGRLVAWGDQFGAVTIVDRRSGQPLSESIQTPGGPPPYAGNVLSFSPDSRHLLAGSNGLALLTVDAADVVVTTLAPALPYGPGEFPFRYADARWSDDGSIVSAIHARDGIRAWDVVTAQQVRQGSAWSAGWLAVRLIDDDTVVLLGDSESVIADAMTGVVRHSLPGTAWPHAVSPDGTRIVSADRDVPGGLILSDARSGERLRSAQPQTTPAVIAFAPDGASIAMAGGDQRVIVLDVDTLTARHWLTGHGGDVPGIRFQTPDRLWTVAEDSSVIEWDLDGGGVGRSVTSELGHTGSGRVSPDGSLVGYTTLAGGIRVYDVASETQVLDVPEALAQGAGSSDWSADSRVFAAIENGSVRVVDVRGGWVSPMIGVQPGVDAVALSPDGARVVVGSPQGISVWDSESGKRLQTADLPEMIDVELEGSNRWIFVALGDSTVRVFDAATLELRKKLELPVTPFALAVSHDSRTLAVGGSDSTVRFYDTSSWRQVDQLVTGELVGVMAYDHAGESLASVGVSGELTVWATRDYTQMAKMSLDRGILGYAGFTDDDSTLVTLSRSGRIVAWDLSIPSVIEHACAVAGRNLTQDEWEQYLPDRPYAQTCSTS